MKPRPRFKLGDSTSIVDFNKLAASTKIEDKLEAAQNPECPAEVLDKIVNDEDLPWGSKEAEILKDAIAANPNTPSKNLLNLYNFAANDNQKALILKNPNCPNKLKENNERTRDEKNVNKFVDLPEDWTSLHKIAAIIYGAYNITKHDSQKNHIINVVFPYFIKDFGSDLEPVWKEVVSELNCETSSYKYRLFNIFLEFSRMNDTAKATVFHTLCDILAKPDAKLTADEDEYLSVCTYYWYADNHGTESKINIKEILNNGIKSIFPDIRNLITLNPGLLNLNNWPSLEEIAFTIDKEYKDIFKGLSFKDYVNNIAGEIEIKIQGKMHFYKFGAISNEIKNALEASISHIGYNNINDLISEMWYGSPMDLLNSVPKEVYTEHPILNHLQICSMGDLWQEFDLFYEVPVIDNDNTITFFKNQKAFFSGPVSSMVIANDSEKDEYDTAEDGNFMKSVWKIRCDFNENLEWNDKKENANQFGEYLAEEGAKLSRFGWSGLEYLVRDKERKSKFNYINFDNRFSVLEYGNFEIKSDTIISGSTNLSKLMWLKDKGINEFGPTRDNYRFSRVFYVDNSGDQDLIKELDFIIENFKISDVTAFQNWPTDE